MATLSYLIIFLLSLNNQPTILQQQSDFELIVFEGSDWCANCRRFEKEVLSDSSFLTYLETKNIKLTKIDFPQRKKISKEQEKTNRLYSEKYKFEGDFPTIILTRTDLLSYQKLSHSNQNTAQLTQQIEQLLKKI